MKTRLLKFLATSVTFAGCVLTTSPAEAKIVFSDNFDGENGGDGALNFNSFSNWDVSDGAVDLIPDRSGTRFDFIPGNGLYVDLDGTQNNAGLFQTKQSFGPGLYSFSFDLAGSTRGSNEEVTVTFGNFSEVLTLASTDPLTTFVRSVTLVSAATLQFQNAGGDNVGALLDNVVVEAVPTPAILPGLVGMSIAAFRKRQQKSEAEA